MGRDGRGVRAASKSSIEITFMYQGQQCKERLSLEPTTANLKRAEQHRAAILHAIDQGVFDYSVTFPNSRKATKFSKVKGSAMTLKAYLDDWLVEKRKHVKDSTWVDYDRIVRHELIPSMGGKPLSEIRIPVVKEWLKGKSVGNKRLANLQSVLRTALDDAVQDEILDSNPLREWTYQIKERTRIEDDEVDPFTAEEQQSILSAATGQIKNLIQFALWTGMRTSELVGLRWGDIDWVKNEVFVVRAVTQRSKAPEDTKTRGSRRKVRLLPLALEALLAQKSYTFLKGEEVFQDPRYQEPWAGDYPIREVFWRRTLQKAGVRYRYPYQTRHTYASMMLSAGEDARWVMAQMGHTSLTMLERRYGRWMPEAAPKAGLLADEVFGKAVRGGV